MIEIEKKFSINIGDFERLTQDAEFVSEKTHADTYYNKKDYSLTTQDVWLRKRNDRFELKSRLHAEANPEVDQYEELETEEEIRNFLKMKSVRTFKEDLETNEYFPFCSYKTTRKHYKKGDFTLDFDLVDFGDFKYEVLEIELMVESKSEVKDASKRILDFAKENGLEIKKVRGKVKTYLSRNDPKHFQALKEAGV